MSARGGAWRIITGGPIPLQCNCGVGDHDECRAGPACRACERDGSCAVCGRNPAGSSCLHAGCPNPVQPEATA